MFVHQSRYRAGSTNTTLLVTDTWPDENVSARFIFRHNSSTFKDINVTLPALPFIIPAPRTSAFYHVWQDMLLASSGKAESIIFSLVGLALTGFGIYWIFLALGMLPYITSCFSGPLVLQADGNLHPRTATSARRRTQAIFQAASGAASGAPGPSPATGPLAIGAPHNPQSPARRHPPTRRPPPPCGTTTYWSARRGTCSRRLTSPGKATAWRVESRFDDGGTPITPGRNSFGGSIPQSSQRHLHRHEIVPKFSYIT